jgi:hypothetical protein
MATTTSTTSTVLGALPAVGAQPAVAGLAALAQAAYAAAMALQTVGSSSGSGGAGALLQLVGGSANSFGGANSAGFGSGAGFGNLDQGINLHDGGVVGRDFAVAPSQPSTFRAMQAGIVLPAPLKDNERRAVLEVGEEVITRDDPRHRANIGRALLERTYHTGGVIGMVADALPLARATNAAMRGAEPRGQGGTGGAAGDTFVTHITVPAGTPRETANQIGNRVAERAAFARRRNG